MWSINPYVLSLRLWVFFSSFVGLLAWNFCAKKNNSIAKNGRCLDRFAILLFFIGKNLIYGGSDEQIVCFLDILHLTCTGELHHGDVLMGEVPKEDRVGLIEFISGSLAYIGRDLILIDTLVIILQFIFTLICSEYTPFGFRDFSMGSKIFRNLF